MFNAWALKHPALSRERRDLAQESGGEHILAGRWSGLNYRKCVKDEFVVRKKGGRVGLKDEKGVAGESEKLKAIED
ncbi:hypothetical protein E2C01_026438 [Portunus trituberculatus]|uniref:Uncharacterized protein n=1 Tax=Portunus trituberculatus TaxID=210409 RepID=A0A5B7EIR5_PORTR|nr:hypothetical protein [Portunus trituberculatus]